MTSRPDPQKARAPHVSSFDTSALEPSVQVRLWEHYAQEHVFQVHCHSVNADTLHGSLRNFETGSVRFADMRATAHVVERTARDVAEDPCELILLIMILEGEATYGQGGVWMTAQVGDILAMRSDQPFLGTYSRPVRQMVMTLPVTEFTDLCGREIVGLERATQAQLGNKSLRWLFEQGLASLDGTGSVPYQAIHGLGLVAALFGRSDPVQGRRMRPHFFAAQAWIADHLSDPTLSPSQIAAGLNISLRHLNRVFAREGVTVRRVIEERRLKMALQLLQDPKHTYMSIGEIAYSCGFSDQSLFSRQFRRQFDLTPTEARLAARP
ncbi:helix-turn-helix domain-containing protein [Pseudodonghicola flavimaris]|uniref:Helix-turn-helix domain-containing protein n=1 Tax=Pseudodonghicola flavimaris TaxID=3050036 RepID=A0ABT7F5F3_9RHOB|nr:helix-turn-helix domain-containing protein [Pseudodonghicola flavimaris]MDK3019826.1 helix-turn-helix domain-containing protein [Pseudodonghicola flavimaris]